MKGENSFMLTKNDTIKAVYDDDLDQLLNQIGLLNDFKEGKIQCRYCNMVISKNNLYAIVPTNPISFCCNSPSCVLSLAEEAQK